MMIELEGKKAGESRITRLEHLQKEFSGTVKRPDQRVRRTEGLGSLRVRYRSGSLSYATAAFLKVGQSRICVSNDERWCLNSCQRMEGGTSNNANRESTI